MIFIEKFYLFWRNLLLPSTSSRGKEGGGVYYQFAFISRCQRKKKCDLHTFQYILDNSLSIWIDKIMHVGK